MCLGTANGTSGRKKYVFIVGDVSTPEGHKNFEMTKHLLMGKGYGVFSFVDVLNALPELTRGGDMHIHYALIDLCDEVFIMKDWENSDKAILDFKYAMGMGKKIRHEE